MSKTSGRSVKLHECITLSIDLDLHMTHARIRHSHGDEWVCGDVSMDCLMH
jgi:hypothetical protein